MQLAAGGVVAALLGVLARLLQDTVSHSEVDILRLGLLPSLEPHQLLVLLGLLALTATMFWGSVLALRVAMMHWRFGGLGPLRRIVWPLVLWIAPVAVGIAAVTARGGDAPTFALLAMTTCVGIGRFPACRYASYVIPSPGQWPPKIA